VPELARALYHDAVALSAGRHRVLLDVATGDWLLGAEEELESAFGNLISNAVRYTPERGEVEIAWRRDGAELIFSVRDSGIGIAAQHIPRLTERFYRVDRSRSRETGGTGLGLAIVKHVLNRHQGRLEIASEPGQGSIFSAVFPAERVIPREAPAALARSA
jgi:two-component system phosphate regulon sensor histidine kinase PhoR